MTKSLIDPELLQAFQGEPPVVDVDAGNLKEVRKSTLEMMAGFTSDERAPVSVTRATARAGSPAHEVPVIVYRPGEGPARKPAILHLHAGGFVLGDARMSEGYCRKLAADTGAVVISVDYRLAPEFPFPAALEDAYAALLWTRDHHESLRIDPNRLAITGESGGGGLAAQLAFWVRDRKEAPVAFQFLTYPMLDDRTGSTRDPGAHAGQAFWTRSSNRFAWSALLGQPAGSSDVSYPAVPARIEDLSGLVPAYLAVGTLDLFAAEVLDYARALAAQGVATELHLYPGATHGFDFAVGTSLSNLFFEERKRAFARAFAGSF